MLVLIVCDIDCDIRGLLWSQEKTSDGGEGQNEAPLVDLSEAKKEEGENSTETKAAEAEVIVSTEAAGDVTAVLAEDKAEVTLEKPEDKVKVEVVEETKETPKKEQVEAKKAEDLATTPASDDKKDAPVVTLWWCFLLKCIYSTIWEKEKGW